MLVASCNLREEVPLTLFSSCRLGWPLEQCDGGGEEVDGIYTASHITPNQHRFIVVIRVWPAIYKKYQLSNELKLHANV